MSYLNIISSSLIPEHYIITSYLNTTSSSVIAEQYIVTCHTWTQHHHLSYLNKPRGKLYKWLINNVIPNLLDNQHCLRCCSPLQDLTAWVLYCPTEQVSLLLLLLLSLVLVLTLILALFVHHHHPHTIDHFHLTGSYPSTWTTLVHFLSLSILPLSPLWYTSNYGS